MRHNHRKDLFVIESTLNAARFVNLPALTVLGKVLITKPMSPEIPVLWTTVMPGVKGVPQLIDRLVTPGVWMGVMDMEGEYLKYMAGEPVEALGLPETPGFERWDIPEGRYAVFDSTLGNISKTFGEIYGSWIHNAGFQRGDGPEFEHYPADFDPQNQNSLVEIYIPLKTTEADL
jgi:AraC family transcriptional regulator